MRFACIREKKTVGSIQALLAAGLMTIGLYACGGPNAGSSTAFSGDDAPQTNEDEIYNAYTGGKKDESGNGLPQVQAKALMEEFAGMDIDRLYEFLRKVSNNSPVAVAGTKITHINDLLKKYRGHFMKIKKDFHRVEDFWSYMRINPKSIGPAEFKASLREMAIFTTRVALPALNKKPSEDKSPLDDSKIRNKGKACVLGTPLLLHSCTNLRSRIACNNLTASMICVVHYMFKSKEEPGKPKKEGFDETGGSEKPGSGNGDGGDGGGGDGGGGDA